MKRIIVPVLAACAISILFASCTSEEPMLKSDPATAQEKASPYRKSINDALKSADLIMADISDAPKTRASGRKIASIQIVGDSQKALTRSGNEGLDTMLYLVNYEDNQGFALLSADWRTKPVYAISDEGNMNLADTTFNKGLALFMENAREDYAYYTSPENIKGPFLPIDTTDIYHPNLPKDDYEYTLYYDIKPKLTRSVSRWHQNSPFNKYVVANKGKQYPVGCVAIALAQLCSASKVPSVFEGRYLDWNIINQDSTRNIYSQGIDDLAFFLWKAGSKYLDMNYGEQGSGAKFGKIHSFLCDMHLNSSGQLEYKGSVPEDSYPVAMSARSSTEDTGHAWILDGGISYQIKGNMCEGGSTFFHFEHCVWGWGGQDNGYYSWSTVHGFLFDHFGDDDDKVQPDDLPNLFDKKFEYIYIIK